MNSVKKSIMSDGRLSYTLIDANKKIIFSLNVSSVIDEDEVFKDFLDAKSNDSFERKLEGSDEYINIAKNVRTR